MSEIIDFSYNYIHYAAPNSPELYQSAGGFPLSGLFRQMGRWILRTIHLPASQEISLATPELETDQERRKWFLRILNRGWLIMTLLALISYGFYPAERGLLSFVICFTFGTYLLVGFLTNKNQTVLAGFIFTLLVNFGFFGAFIASMATTSVVKALESYIYILNMMGLAIIFGGAFIHRWAPFSLAALDSTLLLFLTRIVAPQAGPLFSVHIFWWLLATSTWLYETTLSQALARLQQSRAELEYQVAVRTRKLQETVGKLEQVQKNLQVKNEELESFSYSVSHDLRAPLRAIDGYSEALEEDYQAQLPSEGKHILNRIHENTHRMDQLIQDLLVLSRLDRAQLIRRTVNPAEIAQEIVDDLRKENPSQAIEVTMGDLPACQADPALLRQVYANLLSNAFKFTRHRSLAQVLVSSQPSSKGPVYLVRDNGVGFDMQQARKLFSPFQRMHPPEEYEGTGIGLTIVSRIVQRHGGRVWAEAAEDQGATFYFTLGEPELTGPTLEEEIAAPGKAYPD